MGRKQEVHFVVDGDGRMGFLARRVVGEKEQEKRAGGEGGQGSLGVHGWAHGAYGTTKS